MNEIFAHRALYKSREHSLEGIKNYVESGIGLELDLRYGKNGIYMSHDISDTAELLKDACEILLQLVSVSLISSLVQTSVNRLQHEK